MRKERGITLIALVITIIVLLILAGVAMSTLTGKDNIIQNAGTAVDNYNSQQETDEVVLNTIAVYLEAHMPKGESGGDDDGTGDDIVEPEVDKTPPTVTAKQASVTITEGDTELLSSYFDIVLNGTNKNYTTECTVDGKVYETTESIPVGTHTVICTVTVTGGNSSSTTMELVVEQAGPAVDSNGLATENYTIKPSESSNVQIVIPEGWAPAILTGSNSTISGPGQDGKVKSIMPADQWKNITIEQINKGIVIVDHAITYDNGQATGTVPDFNEFVWVPIPDSDDFDRIEWTIETAVASQNLVETSTSRGWWEDQTTTEYTNMVSSVEQHKGFYIGRYEASLNGAIAQSKRGQEAKGEISQTASITACTSNTSIPNMHLMYGIEWDSTLNWLKGNATIASSTTGVTKTMGLADLQTNSSTWGNSFETTGDAASTPYVKATIQNTGASEYWKANNIYDLAGNVSEWTQETYLSLGSLRGYNDYLAWHDCPVAERVYASPEIEDADIRFQSQLLLVALTSGMKI